MDNLQLSQVHKTDKVTFIRQVPWCALVQSPSLSLQEQALRKSLFTSDIFGTVTRIAVTVNSSGLAQTAGWRPLTFALSLPWKFACCHSLLCSFSMTHRARSGSAHAWLPSIKSCKEYAQAVHTQRTLGWQLTLSFRLVDTEFPMVKAPTEAKSFLLSVFVISSMALSIFEVRSLTEKTAWCSN